MSVPVGDALIGRVVDALGAPIDDKGPIATDQRLQFFLKKDVKEVIHERKSLMPPYLEDALSASQLRDLISYLETLRGN